MNAVVLILALAAAALLFVVVYRLQRAARQSVGGAGTAPAAATPQSGSSGPDIKSGG